MLRAETNHMTKTSRPRRRRAAVAIVALIAAATAAAPRAQQDTPRFDLATGVSIVLVDIVVRDSSGNVVRGLSPENFRILEDKRPQKIESFQFKDVDAAAVAAAESEIQLLQGLEDKLRAEVKRAASAESTTVADPSAITPEELANRRMLVLLFDVSSMQQEDLERAADAGNTYVDEQMTDADLISVVTIGSRLQVVTDFTSNRETVQAALNAVAYPDSLEVTIEGVETAATDAAAQTETAATETAGFEEFNNDVRLRAIKTLCETLTPIQQKKAVMYFSSGMRAGSDNQIELRAATNTCTRGNVAIYPADSRGLQAVVAGGGATSRGGTGTALFTGRSNMNSFTQQMASTETLTTLAADTGGRAFTNTNDFSAAFARVQNDLAAYYLIGYSSTNTAEDGRFRRIQVQVVGRTGLKVEAREGYYAHRSFVNTNRRDRESQLTDQLNASISSTDVPMIVGTGWFRQAQDRFYVPIAMVVPGSSVPVPQGADKALLDVRGMVRDEQGRTIAPIKGTIEVPSGGAETLAGRQVLYQTSAILPPGRFWVKLVVRENTGGAVGSFEAPINIPSPQSQGLKVSPVVLSTQVQKAPDGRSDNPLIRDGVALVPNLTRAVARNQPMYFYYEVYDPGLMEQAPHLRTSLAFYRGKVKVFETPVVEKTTIDEPGRQAVVFRFEVPADSFKPGTYDCQVNVIDTVANAVSFPRLILTVM
jgi:VWFA-related protein